MRNWIGAIAALAFLTANQAPAAAQTSSDITSRVAKIVRQTLPAGYNVTISGPLTIRVAAHGMPPFQVNLDNINRVCGAAPDRCDVVMADFAAQTAQSVKEQMGPLLKGEMRAVVRSADYVDGMKRAMNGEELVAASLFGDLVELCYFDRPTSMIVATESDIRTLGLTSEEALAVCKNNVEATLPKLRSVIRIPPRNPLGMLTDDAYQSSRILFHDDWSSVAAQLGGHLVVAVPASDVVIFGRESDPVAVRAVANLARKMFDEAQRPVSTKVFRWTATGWDVVDH